MNKRHLPIHQQINPYTRLSIDKPWNASLAIDCKSGLYPTSLWKTRTLSNPSYLVSGLTYKTTSWLSDRKSVGGMLLILLPNKYLDTYHHHYSGKEGCRLRNHTNTRALAKEINRRSELLTCCRTCSWWIRENSWRQNKHVRTFIILQKSQIS